MPNLMKILRPELLQLKLEKLARIALSNYSNKQLFFSVQSRFPNFVFTMQISKIISKQTQVTSVFGHLHLGR